MLNCNSSNVFKKHPLELNNSVLVFYDFIWNMITHEKYNVTNKSQDPVHAADFVVKAQHDNLCRHGYSNFYLPLRNMIWALYPMFITLGMEKYNHINTPEHCDFSHLLGSPPWSGSQFVIQLRDVALRKQACNTMEHTLQGLIYMEQQYTLRKLFSSERPCLYLPSFIVLMGERSTWLIA